MIEPNFNQKQELARDLIRYYLSARRGLTELGILRSERNLQSDYAEWLAVELLAVQLNIKPLQKGVDATDRAGRTYQIRWRIVEEPDQATFFEFDTYPAPFDFLVGVLFSIELDVLAMVRIPYELVRELGRQSDGGFRFPWDGQTANHPRIEKIVWKKN
jgi:hypothetical protein